MDEAKSKLVELTNLEIANRSAELSARGLGNSSMIFSVRHGIEKHAAEELDRMQREYNRAIEEIAYIDRKISLQRNAFWKRIIPFFSKKPG